MKVAKIIKKTLLGLLLLLAIIIVILAVLVIVFRISGKKELYSRMSDVTLNLTLAQPAGTEYKTGTILYQDTPYEYCDNVLNFLMIEKNKERVEALLLLVVNQDTEETKAVSINPGILAGITGDCEEQVKAVSNAMMSLPIHGYVALQDESIALLAETVGEKEYNLEDLKPLAKKVLSKTKEDLTFPIDAFNLLKDDMITNLGVDEVTYIVTSCIGYRHDVDNVLWVRGTEELTEKGELKYIPNEEALNDMMVDLFFQKIKEQKYE